VFIGQLACGAVEVAPLISHVLDADEVASTSGFDDVHTDR
jgi:hypothetical protein